MTFRNHKDLVLFIYLAVSESRSVVSDSLWPRGFYHPWTSPGENPGVGGLSLLQGIFPTQGWNPGVLNCRQVLPRWAAGQPLLVVLGLCGGALAPLLGGAPAPCWVRGLLELCHAGETCCSVACGILLPWPGIELLYLYWKADSQWLDHQGSTRNLVLDKLSHLLGDFVDSSVRWR